MIGQVNPVVVKSVEGERILASLQLHEQAAAEARAHRGSTGVRQHRRYKPGVVVKDAV